MTYKVFHGVVAEVYDVVVGNKLPVRVIASNYACKLPFDVDFDLTTSNNNIAPENWKFDDRMTIKKDSLKGSRGSVYVEHSQYIEEPWYTDHINPWPPAG